MNKKRRKNLLIVGEYDLSRLLNISISSAKIKRIELPKGKLLRPQLHTIIYGRMGSAKSSILWEVAQAVKSMPVTQFGVASLYGAVDKQTGTLNPPMIWQARNSCLLVDEYVFDHHAFASVNLMQGLLPVLENPYVNKKVGYRCNEVNEKDGDLFLKVKDGTIECKTRFVLIMDTMMNLKGMKSMWIKALMSRCLVIPHYPTLDDLHRLAQGGSFYNFESKNTEPVVKISSKVYKFILDYCVEHVKSPEAFLRTIGDCCRVYAVLRRHDEEIYNTISKMREQLG